MLVESLAYVDNIAFFQKQISLLIFLLLQIRIMVHGASSMTSLPARRGNRSMGKCRQAVLGTVQQQLSCFFVPV